ncbi:hypothetical protein AURDEDRAFT_20223, partial [Auricularia subglabra TFB-10046 SS5]
QKNTLWWGICKRTQAQHRCPHCGVEFLSGEAVGFCCGPNGQKRNDVQPLPPLPAEYAVFVNDRNISSLSRLLNLIYSFAQLESSQPFPSLPEQAHFAVQGRIFHR